ncbi:MAG: hypothetical protein Kow0069_20070 [Promethearchaeota archaeon]
MSLFLVLASQLVEPTSAGASGEVSITRVLYYHQGGAGGGGGGDENSGDRLLAAISLDDGSRVEAWQGDQPPQVDPCRYDVVVLVDAVLNASARSALIAHREAGGGVVFVAGPRVASEPQLLVDLGVIAPTAVDKVQNGTEAAVAKVNVSVNPFAWIDWNSCPEFSKYTRLPHAPGDLGSGAVVAPLVKKPRDDSETLDPDPLVLHLPSGDHSRGETFVVAGWLADPSLRAQHLWPYFNYFAYSLVALAAGKSPAPYADWEHSPVPHAAASIPWTIAVVGLVAATFLLFRRQRARSKRMTAANIPGTTATPEVSAEASTEGEGGEPRLMKDEEINDWEEIGYHRQLAGFLFALFMALILLGPQLLLTLWIYPQYVMPFPQAAGYMSFTTRFFEAFWLFLDFGTSTAAAKFFAQYRVKHPRRALRYVQIYVWWQFLSGAGQFAFVSVVGMFVFPRAQYAHMSWFFVLHSMIQFPGFMAVVIYFFQGAQKLDTAQLLQVLKTVVFTFAFQYVMILVGRAAFGARVEYGEAFGAVVGMALGSWLSEFAFFALSYSMFRKQGYRGSSLFRVDFTGVELKETFKYGLRLVAGNVWVPLVWFLQVIVLSLHVTDYSSEMAYFDMAYTLTQVMALVGLYLEGMMPPVSEALGNDKRKLLDLGMVEMVRTMNWLRYFVGAAMLVVGQRIIVGFAGPTWERATVYFGGLLLHAFLGPWSWAGDRVFQGTGRTDLNLYTWILEQGVRAVAMLLLIPRFGVIGVVHAYNLALATKDVTVWILIRRKIWHGPWYPWKMFVAPAAAAALTWLTLESFARGVWAGDALTTIAVVLVSVFGGLFLNAFLNGLFGTWDSHLLADFARAAGMVKTVGFFARGLYGLAALGAKASPLREFNAVAIYEEAMAEAAQLTREKRVLDV